VAYRGTGRGSSLEDTRRPSAPRARASTYPPPPARSPTSSLSPASALVLTHAPFFTHGLLRQTALMPPHSHFRLRLASSPPSPPLPPSGGCMTRTYACSPSPLHPAYSHPAADCPCLPQSQLIPQFASHCAYTPCPPPPAASRWLYDSVLDSPPRPLHPRLRSLYPPFPLLPPLPPPPGGCMTP
jgi:hypothetical protein